MKTFGERLKELRIASGLGQKEVAAWIGVSDSSIRKYESGERTPDPKAIKTLANQFNVTTDYLLGNDTPTSGYYDDPEVAEMANRMKDDPDMKILFDASKKLSKDDLQFVIDMVNRMKK